jgi:hypothetical protein
MGRMSSLLLGVIAHLNILIAITTLLFIEVILIVITLSFQILTLSIGGLFLFILLASRGVSAFHLVVLAISGLVRLFEFLEESSLEFTLLSTVGTTIVGLAIGLRLVRRVLSGGRILGIPRNHVN